MSVTSDQITAALTPLVQGGASPADIMQAANAAAQAVAIAAISSGGPHVPTGVDAAFVQSLIFEFLALSSLPDINPRAAAESFVSALTANPVDVPLFWQTCKVAIAALLTATRTTISK